MKNCNVKYFNNIIILFKILFTYLYFFFIFLLLHKYSCLHFPTISPRPPSPRLPPLILPPLALSMCPLYMFFDGLSPIFRHYPFLPSPLVTVSLFFISMYLVIFSCFFILLIWYLIYFKTLRIINLILVQEN